MAAATGVMMELLEPPDKSDTTTVYEDGGNIQVRPGRSQLASSWFADVDEELQQEWDALMESDGDDTANGIKKRPLEDVKLSLKNGEVVSREAMQGVRVGSAGGWSLEVFPGDFVVHRYVVK
jgi:hypothetical protein